MDLELSDDQFDLRDNIRSVLEGACQPALVRSIYDGGGSADALWTQMVELYWPALGVAEDAGGLGLGFVELGLLAEELGRVAAPGPLLAVVSQFIPVLTEAGAEDELAAAAAGESVGALALAENGRWDLDAVDATATEANGGWRVSGTKAAVLAGAHADRFAVVARTDSGIGAWLVDAANSAVTITDVIDPGLGLADVAFEDAPATLLLAPGPATTEALTRVIEQATVAMALHTVGACRRIFEVTLEYAKVREQYDKVIGSFQALKHRFADMFLAVERANAVGYYAALAIAEDDEARAEAVNVAKAAAGDCQKLVAEDGLQLHGGIGFTWENDLHFLLKRAKAGEVLCGGRTHHRAQLAGRLGLLGASA
ncbi:MAG: acyl-CoA dehydrogenase family protein [Acidimicrobiales bacterium]|nr:acyl-CoA dehydrogenase family protein [Acidimicrobiales bacterium]